MPNADVEAEAVAHSMQQPADGHFRGRVPSPNPAHVPGAAFFRQAVAHTSNGWMD